MWADKYFPPDPCTWIDVAQGRVTWATHQEWKRYERSLARARAAYVRYEQDKTRENMALMFAEQYRHDCFHG